MAEQEQQSDTKSQSSGAKRIYRSTKDKMLCGVCGGFADYFGIDSTLVRVIWAVSVLVGGVGLLAYVLGCVVIPKNPKPETEKDLESPTNTNLMWGLILVAVGLFFLMQGWNWWDIGRPFHFHWRMHPFGGFSFLLPVVLILIGVYYLFNAYKKGKTDEVSEAPKTGGQQMQKKLFRSKSEKMIAGVCGGLAEYFNIDPSFVRIGFALLTLSTAIFFGVAAYIIMMIVVPEEEDKPAAPVAQAQEPSEPEANDKK
jgi:phage shock protein PspC (stress-responsive transcriptional regulator)